MRLQRAGFGLTSQEIAGAGENYVDEGVQTTLPEGFFCDICGPSPMVMNKKLQTGGRQGSDVRHVVHRTVFTVLTF